MSEILAVFERRGSRIESQNISSMMAAGVKMGTDGSHYWSNDHVMLGNHHLLITPEEQNERQPVVDVEQRLAITADVRLDNRAEIISLLGLDVQRAASKSDSELILLGYQRWSTACVTRLVGDFAFVIWDGREEQLFAARDPLGVRQIYYTISDERLVVATEIEAILAHSQVERRINRLRVAEYLALQMDSRDQTYFAGIHYCPPAHCLLVSDDNFRLWRYWNLDISVRLKYKDPRDYGAHFQELLRRSVRDRLRGVGPIGVSLSGGLDSTSVASLAATELRSGAANQGSLRSYSYVFDELRSCDEREFIAPVIERYDLQPRFVLGDSSWPLRDLSNWPVPADPVSFDPYWWLIIGLMEAAKQDGTRMMLTGHFGDWLFEGAVYWAADMMRDLRLRALWSIARSSSLRANWINLVDRGLRQFIPLRARQAFRTIRPRSEASVGDSVHPALVGDIKLAERMAQRQHEGEYGASWMWKRYRDLTHGVVPPTMGAIASMWRRHGIEHLEPMRDRSIVEFILSIPADQLGLPGAGNSRRVLREGMKGILPDSVRLRRDKTSFRALYLRGLMGEERGTVERILQEPEIVRRQLVDPNWLARTLPGGCHYSDEGFSLWRCVTLELWLQKYWK